MKKNNTKGNDLLAKLAASLKESPLAAHARQAEKATEVVVDKAKVESRLMTPKAKPIIFSNSKMEEMPADNITVGEGSATPKLVLKRKEETEAKAAVVAGQLAVSPEAVVTAVAPAVQMPAANVSASTMAATSPAVPTREELLQKMEQMSAMVAQLTRGVSPLAATQSFVPQMPAYTPTIGFGRGTQSGWKTSTVGLYPEDYEKARAAMAYLQQQTGEAINLSRVVKIALRQMEVGPKLLETNSQIKAKDGRLLSRRG
jgi:hypothetical protein